MNSGRRLFVFVYLMLSMRGAAAAPDLASDAAALLTFHAAVAPRRLRWAPGPRPGGHSRKPHSAPDALAPPQRHHRSAPGDLAALSAELRTFSLRGNRISGEFPPPILALHRLRRLDLAGNLLSGPIPPGLDLLSLVSFNVSCNPLAGPIPRHSVTCRRAHSMAPISAAPHFPSAVVTSLWLLLRRRPRRSPAARYPGRDRSHCDWIRRRAPLPRRAPLRPPPPLPPPRGDQIEAEPGGERRRRRGREEAGVRGRGTGVRARYDLKDLMRASAEVLGKGTFGTTYKAAMETDESSSSSPAEVVVAVKRLREVHLPEKEFRQQVAAIGEMEHPNLMPLLAYYYSKEEKLLVYEFMAMGSLSSILHGNKRSGRTHLDLEARIAVALAAARGVEYIHSAGPNSSHGNIKSSNILLSASYSDTRIADHGLARLIGPAAAPTSTPTRNNAAYRAPEVTDIRGVSQKADVYSFGVLLLELLTGKSADSGVELPRWARAVLQEEWTQEVFDAALTKARSSPAAAEEAMLHLLKLALDCTTQLPDERPAMAGVVARIDKIRAAFGERGRRKIEIIVD
uniref:Protein kinase domain-containing protein n=1 Tax=Ananas comosus var. bracteatus TaxID=296719 RepID=A0A6V7P341_ANACO|nr:unnamed protein product [Ananas comosus var. bracteatus]